MGDKVSRMSDADLNILKEVANGGRFFVTDKVCSAVSQILLNRGTLQAVLDNTRTDYENRIENLHSTLINNALQVEKLSAELNKGRERERLLAIELKDAKNTIAALQDKVSRFKTVIGSLYEHWKQFQTLVDNIKAMNNTVNDLATESLTDAHI